MPPLFSRLPAHGPWHNLPEEERIALPKIPTGIMKLIINGSTLEEVDTSGAWLIVRSLRDIAPKGIEVEWMGFAPAHMKLISMVGNLKHEKVSGPPASAVYAWLVSLGKFSVYFRKEAVMFLNFFGQLCVCIARSLRQPKRLRIKSIFFHANEVGVKAMPIVVMMAFFISLVLGYQGANQLRMFGATIYAVNLVSISMLREMGVLITAIMCAGRSSSAFAAQIGVMQMNDEVAAMRTTGLDPFELLVLPRILGIIIVLPALTFLADLSGLLGTYLVSVAYLDLSYSQFSTRLQQAVNEMTFYIGLMKAPVFAFIIGMIGCFQGLQVRTSATELGKRTTTAVVQSIFLVVLVDALFSLLFTALNI